MIWLCTRNEIKWTKINWNLSFLDDESKRLSQSFTSTAICSRPKLTKNSTLPASSTLSRSVHSKVSWCCILCRTGAAAEEPDTAVELLIDLLHQMHKTIPQKMHSHTHTQAESVRNSMPLLYVVKAHAENGQPSSSDPPWCYRLLFFSVNLLLKDLSFHLC